MAKIIDVKFPMACPYRLTDNDVTHYCSKGDACIDCNSDWLFSDDCPLKEAKE
jgi:hypothetical protein